MSKTYNLFISHSWTYEDAYKKLTQLLDDATGFTWRDYSVPKDDPIHKASNQQLLEEALRRKMRSVHCVLILAGVYAAYSKWINIEIELAKELKKPIIAIEPWGAEKTSAKVKESADRIVKWRTQSIVDAVREVAI